jgi:hypothetical protein
MRTTQPPPTEGHAVELEGPASRRRRTWWIAAAVAVVVALALGVFVLVRDGDDEPQGAPGSTTMPTTSPGSTASTSPSTTTSSPAAQATVVWPAPGSATRFATPLEAARSFGVDFHRFRHPVVGAFEAGDSRSGEVPVQPRAPGPVTTILVRQVGAGEDWSVLGAATDGITVESPDAGAAISSPVRVTGQALAFEGTVLVEVREDGRTEAIGKGFVTGGGGEKLPFSGEITFDKPTSPYGAVVFFTESAENGEVWEAGAVRVAFRSTGAESAACGSYRATHPPTSADRMEVKVFFNCDAGGAGDVSAFPVYRSVPRTSAVLRASVEALLAGPTEKERDASISSWFSKATAGMLRSATITKGHAVLDFGDLRPVIPNASASAGSALLLSQLDATVFQFPSVTSAEYRIGGSCTDFSEWLQFGGCTPRTRGG